MKNKNPKVFKFIYDKDIQKDFKTKFLYKIFLSPQNQEDIYKLRDSMRIELTPHDILFDLGEFVKESNNNKWVIYIPEDDDDEEALNQFVNTLQKSIMFNNNITSTKNLSTNDKHLFIVLANIYESIKTTYLDEYPKISFIFYKLLTQLEKGNGGCFLSTFPTIYKICQKINKKDVVDVEYKSGKIFSILSTFKDVEEDEEAIGEDTNNTKLNLISFFILVKYIENNILNKKYDVAINKCNEINLDNRFLQLCKVEDTCGYLYSNFSKQFLRDILKYRTKCNFSILYKTNIFNNYEKNFKDIESFQKHVLPYLIKI